MYNQRVDAEKLKQWEQLKFGAMIHYGLPTFTGWEQDPFSPSPAVYDPFSLSVDQWVDGFARLGLRYAILTAKHNSGFCLWPSEYTDYHVGYSGNDSRDVVGLFADACRKRGILPCLYYNLGKDFKVYGDAGHREEYIQSICETAGTDRFNVPDHTDHVTEQYMEYALNQLTELLCNYGPIFQIWLDQPSTPRKLDGCRRTYEHIASVSPDTLILMNQGFSDCSTVYPGAWPTDLVCGEQTTPPESGHNPVKDIDGKKYYVPMEVDCTVGSCWFYKFSFRNRLRSYEDLRGVYERTVGKGANLVWNFGPDRRGRIPQIEFDLVKKVMSNCQP